VLRAQKAVRTLARAAAARGATIVRAKAAPRGAAVALDDGRTLEADRVIWSCGGWLAKLFPGLVRLTVTQQELYFLDGGPEWRTAPGWVDYDRATYGTGDVDDLGVKAAWDAQGPPLDPDADLPAGTPEIERLTRGYLRDRFPALAEAPLKDVRTCRYELSPDSHFIAAPHPEHPSAWIVGGGSGHGFKHGPAMAERLAATWDGGAPLPPRFALGDRMPGSSLPRSGRNGSSAQGCRSRKRRSPTGSPSIHPPTRGGVQDAGTPTSRTPTMLRRPSRPGTRPRGRRGCPRCPPGRRPAAPDPG